MPDPFPHLCSFIFFACNISTALKYIQIVFGFSWNRLQSVTPGIRMSQMSLECPLDWISFPGSYTRTSRTNQASVLIFKPRQTPLYSWLSLFLASQKAFQHELTPSESYSVDRGRPHSHYTTLVATCVLGHLKCALRNSVSVHSGYIHTCIEWFTCDATISVTLWGVGEAIVSRLKECRGARMKRVWKTRGNTEV